MGSQDSPTSLHCYQITCSLTVQALDSNRFSGNKQSHKNAIISLGRNESREIVVQISFGPKIRPASYLLKDVKAEEVSPKSSILLHSETVFLSGEQKRVIKTVMDKKSIFFTGSAGTGKSLVLKRLIGSLPHETTFITAATGVAACQVGGQTLHSFAGIGNGSGSVDHCIDMALRPAVAPVWKKCSHLIIDEISMIDADFFTKLEKSPAWDRCVQKTVSLNTVRRQDDPQFVQILQGIRFGRMTREALTVLEETRNNEVDKNGVLATRLCTHKIDADMINQSHMNELQGQEKVFRASDSEQLPDSAGECVCPRLVTLKPGAQVMLTKNMDLSKNLCNGSRGVVKEFKSGLPVVKFVSGYVEVIRPARFHIKLSSTRSSVIRTQIPLQLAWAMSIHKSQGMSLDCVEMSLSRVFEDGQAYVALSRARSLKGLRVMDMDMTCVRANKDVLEFYEKLEMEDRSMADIVFEDSSLPLKRQRLIQQFR